MWVVTLILFFVVVVLSPVYGERARVSFLTILRDRHPDLVTPGGVYVQRSSSASWSAKCWNGRTSMPSFVCKIGPWG